MKFCSKCKKLLTRRNWLPSIKKKKWKICRNCARKRSASYWKKTKKIQNKKQKQKRLERKIRVLRVYGKGKLACICCGENILEFLTLDHGHNDGAKVRKSISGDQRWGGLHLYRMLENQGYPKNKGLRTMCFNCNAGRRLGICPHKKVK